jgi:hypothetical protein
MTSTDRLNLNDFVVAGFLRNAIFLKKNSSVESNSVIQDLESRLLHVKPRIINGFYGDDPRAIAESVTLSVIQSVQEIRPRIVSAVLSSVSAFLFSWKSGLFDWIMKAEEDDGGLFDVDVIDILALSEVARWIDTWLWGGITLEERIDLYLSSVRASLFQAIAGAISGEPDPDEAAMSAARMFSARVLNRSTPTSLVRGVKSLIEMGASSAAGGITIDAVRRNPGFFIGIQWNKSLESNVCPRCNALHGVVFQADSLPAFPQHINCHCFLVPVVRGYQASKIEPFEVSFARLPESTRRQILGDRGFDSLSGRPASRRDLFREAGV